MHRPRIPHLLAALALAVPALATSRPPPTPLEERLAEYRSRIRDTIQADMERFEDIRTRSPRAEIVWRGQSYRFPPPPEPSPDLDILLRLYPLSALPPAWIAPLEKIGADLFLRGVEDGRAGAIGKPWRPYARHLEDRDLDRETIYTLAEIFPDYAAKVDYSREVVDFPALEKLAEQVTRKVLAIPGIRRGPVQLPDDAAEARPLLDALHAYEARAREVGLQLRRRAQGIAKAALIALQGSVYAAVTDALGHPPQPRDVAEIREVLPGKWMGLVQLHHARQYFAGYNALTRGTTGNTGTGSTDEPLEGGGTGTGEGPFELVTEGGGTGAGTTAMEAIGNTGDGALPVDSPGGTGTGTGG